MDTQGELMEKYLEGQGVRNGYDFTKYEIFDRDSLLTKYIKILSFLQQLQETRQNIENDENTLKTHYEKEKELLNPFWFMPADSAKLISIMIGVVSGSCAWIGNVNAGLFQFIIGFALGTFGGFVFCIIINIVCGLDKERYQKVMSEATAQQLQYHSENTLPVETRLEEEKAFLSELLECNTIRSIDDILPKPYQNMEALNFFIQALQTRRADTEKELFNLYEEELHRMKMVQYAQAGLEIQKQTLDSQKQQTESLKQVQQNQEKLSSQVRYGNVVSTVDAVRHWNDAKKK